MIVMKVYFALGATIFTAALLLLLNFTGCGHPLTQFQGDLPAVISVSPIDGATDIETSATIHATFNNTMDPSSINSANFSLSTSAGAIAGIVSYDATSKTASFTPSSLLPSNETFTASLSANIKDTAGNGLGSSYIWHFSTAGLITVTGTPDTTFGTNGVVDYYIDSPIIFADGADLGTERTNSIAFSSGKIILTGTRYDFIVGHSMSIWRFDKDGSLDKSFGSNGESNYSGKLGSTLSSFYSGSIDIDDNGRLLIAGESFIDEILGSSETNVVAWRYNTNGLIDGSFGTNGIVAISAETIGHTKIALNSADNKINLMETITTNLLNKTFIWRLSDNGIIDQSFGTQGVSSFPASGEVFTLDSSGNIIVTGINGKDLIIRKFNSNGVLLNTFGNIGTAVYLNARGRAIALDSSGNILIAGTAGNNPAVWRYTSNGSLDPSFNNGGIYTYSKSTGSAKAIMLDNDGRIYFTGYLIAGNNCKMILQRLNPDGSLDAGFGNNGEIISDLSTLPTAGQYRRIFANSLALDSSGRILVGGDFNGSMIIWRFK